MNCITTTHETEPPYCADDWDTDGRVTTRRYDGALYKNEDLRSIGSAIVNLWRVTRSPGDVADSVSRLVGRTATALAAKQWREDHKDLPGTDVFVALENVEAEAERLTRIA